MTTPALIDRSLRLRPWASAGAAPAAACVEGAFAREKRLDQAPRAEALEDACACGHGLGEQALAASGGAPLQLLRSTGPRRHRAAVGELGYWIRTDDLE